MTQRLDRILFGDFRLSIPSQAVYRIAFAGFLLTNDAVACLVPVDAIPTDMWNPPYEMHFLSSPPSARVLSTASAALMGACLLLALGIAPQWHP